MVTSYIPEVREKTLKPLESKVDSKEQPNEYWEGYLNENQSQFIVGYDYCTDAMMNMLDNLKIYKSLFDIAKINIENIDMSIMDEDKNLDEYSEDELNRMTSETKILKAIQGAILKYAERERSELIVSMIDELSEDEYFRIKKDVDKNNKKNAILRFYEE